MHSALDPRLRAQPLGGDVLRVRRMFGTSTQRCMRIPTSNVLRAQDQEASFDKTRTGTTRGSQTDKHRTTGDTKKYKRYKQTETKKSDVMVCMGSGTNEGQENPPIKTNNIDVTKTQGQRRDTYYENPSATKKLQPAHRPLRPASP